MNKDILLNYFKDRKPEPHNKSIFIYGRAFGPDLRSSVGGPNTMQAGNKPVLYAA
jgi:hypothetical protein